jgi:ribosome-associated translation inhibitor RaiA
MQVLVNSDHHIVGGEDLTERVRGVVEGRLDRFDGRITRVEVHLHDLNSRTRGVRAALLGERDKRCLMEARVGGLKPIAVSHEAPTITEAIHVAADKLERALEHAFGKLAEMAGRMPPEGQIASIEALQELERTEADHR